MSESSSNPGAEQSQAAAGTGGQSHQVVRPLPSQTFESTAAFMEIYECAKLNSNWNKVSSTLAEHPQWLIKIPEGRRWTILHQIVFSGDVTHLNEVLGLQINNPDFRLLCKTLDDKTVREVARERGHAFPQMLRRIERLVSNDQLLDNAKDGKWESVKQCIRSQPDIVNEKPPYRRFYLAHFLADIGDLNMFKELSKLCHFKLDLLVDNKTISQVAREQNHTEFAEYIDTLTTQPTENNNNNDNDDDDDLDSLHPNGEHHYSPGFYEDVGISFIPANLNLNNLFPPTTSSHFNHNHNHYYHHQPQHYSTSYGHNPLVFTSSIPMVSIEQNSIGAQGYSQTNNNNNNQAKSVQKKPSVPQMTEEEQAVYEQKIKENVHKMSQENLLSSITCPITKSIFHDPVVAADGHTYEREAILNWLKTSNRSPMTNEVLDNHDLKPNFNIKSILQAIQQGNKS